jgi:phage terminase large subunit
MYQQTTALQKLAKLKQRLRFVAGGTSASKTISIEQLLIDDAQTDTTPTLTSIVSETLPHLRKGAIRDFLSILQEHQYFEDNRWNASEHTYTFPLIVGTRVYPVGSKIEFFSADQPGKVRGPRRDRLFVNEGNNIPFETFDQLLVRTKEYAYVDWNPVAHFWAYDMMEQRKDIDFLTLTYKDNEALDKRIVADIESHRGNKNWWRVYGEGMLGEVEGRIYTGWQTVDDIPHEARLVRFGLDFGYSQDPASIVAVYYYNGGYIIDEVLYARQMRYQDLGEAILNQDQRAVTYADSADPRGIDEIYRQGVPIMPIAKGRDSINNGIRYVQDQRISVTKRSVNIMKEYRSYLWETDKDGKITTDPQDFDNHAMDAIRYAFESLRAPVKRVQQRVRQVNLGMPA